LNIYTASGSLIDTPVSTFLSPGKYTYNWSAVNSSSGVYFAVLSKNNNSGTNNIRSAVKLVLTK